VVAIASVKRREDGHRNLHSQMDQQRRPVVLVPPVVPVVAAVRDGALCEVVALARAVAEEGDETWTVDGFRIQTAWPALVSGSAYKGLGRSTHCCKHFSSVFVSCILVYAIACIQCVRTGEFFNVVQNHISIIELTCP
jgi:hypothetical protein